MGVSLIIPPGCRICSDGPPADMQKDRELLGRSFFEQEPTRCARELVGCGLEWKGCSGLIVETEAYEAEGDAACHTHARPSARLFIAEHEAGTAYVYLNYGMHWLFNLLVKGGEKNGFVLVRALEPLRGLPLMRRRRGRKEQGDLCSGPGKLTQALGIEGNLHGVAVLESRSFALWRPGDEKKAEPLACRRVGISSAVSRKWRFVREGSPFLSVAPGRE